MEEAAAKAVAIANQHDFSKPLALAADHYAALEQCVKDVRAAAGQFHSEWVASGDHACLAAAQGLGIKGALLHALHAMRVHHMEWLGPTPVASPQSLACVLPLFREALSVCEKHSEAVQFPIHGMDPALAYLQQQVAASRHSLETGEWQGTPDGQWHARRQRSAQPPAAAQPGAAPPDPFAGVKADCRDFSEVVQQLRDTLARGPASRRAAPTLATRAAPPPQTPEPVPGPPEPHAPKPAAATPLHAWERSFKSVLLAGLPAPRPLEAPPRPRSPMAPMTVATPAGPADGPARRRQEPIDALQAALAEAGRLGEQAARARSASGPAADTSWADHSRAFQGWQAAALAYHACAEKLATETGADGGLGSSDPAVQGLRQQIHTASRDALAHAGRAARDTLAAFSKTCHDALARKDAQAAGLPSPAELQRHCRDLQQQCLEAPLRLHLPELEAHIARYNACEVACDATMNEPDSIADALYKAEQLRPAAGQEVYAQLRNDLLRKAAYTEIADLDDACGKLAAALTPAQRARNATVQAFDVLLIGDPLPDERTGASGSQASPAQAPSVRPQGDPALARQAREIARIAYERRERSIELPDDAPRQAVRDLQAAQASLHQMRLAAQTTAAALGGFHELAAAFDDNSPSRWPAFVQQHVDDLKQLSIALTEALQAHQKLVEQRPDPQLQKQLERGSQMLRANRFFVARTQLALETLGSLLALRVSANQTRRRLEQGQLDKLLCPVMTGEAHHKAHVALETSTHALDKLLQDEAGVFEEELRTSEDRFLRQNAVALSCRAGCDAALVRGQLLVDWGLKALEPGSGQLCEPKAISDFIDDVLAISRRLAKINKDDNELPKVAALSPYGDRYKAQIAINRIVQRRLLELHGELRKRLPPDAATGSRATKTQ